VRFTVAVVSIDVDELAKRLYVDPGDVRVILATLTDAIADAVSNELSGEIRMILDGFGFRTMPQL
jgi:CO/xanthine dehydrogenase Mo-binding subunit